MKKNGFTLIELLAVIVILAVIALIATPVIMNAIADAKKGAAKDAAYGYVKAVEYSMALAANETNAVVNDTNFTNKLIPVKGTAPNAVALSIKDGAVNGGYVVVDGYSIQFNSAGVASFK